MFGISGGEFFILLLVIVVVVGPQRLPEYTRKLTQLVHQLRIFVDNAKEQIAEEVGPELADLNLKDLDPRQYDPRKIVRDALGEDLDAIKKDLVNPFQSVAQTAKELSEGAAADVNEETGANQPRKSLKEMIEDKAEETRAAQEPAAEATDESPTPELASAKEVTTEGGTDTSDSSEEAEAAEVPQQTETEPGEDAEAETGEALEEAAENAATEEAEAEPEAEGEPEAEAAEAETQQDVEPDAEPEPEPEAASSEEIARAASVIPSSVEEDPQIQEATAVRILSPRDIVRASRAAARTPREAATASVTTH